MLVKTYCAAVNGLEVTTVTVEVSLNTGVMYHLTGLGDEAVRESRNRIAAAMQYSGYKFPIADITINLAPANLRKEGSSFRPSSSHRHFRRQWQHPRRSSQRIHDGGRIEP